MKTYDEAIAEMWAKFDEGRRERGQILRFVLERGITLDELERCVLPTIRKHREIHKRLVMFGPLPPYCIPLTEEQAAEWRHSSAAAASSGSSASGSGA